MLRHNSMSPVNSPVLLGLRADKEGIVGVQRDGAKAKELGVSSPVVGSRSNRIKAKPALEPWCRVVQHLVPSV